jgi:hypothetical protein
MTFNDIIETLRSGKAYRFTRPGLAGYFYKAPFPEDRRQTKLDDAVSAITYWDKRHQKASPTLMLYDFDSDDWTIEDAAVHPMLLGLN